MGRVVETSREDGAVRREGSRGRLEAGRVRVRVSGGWHQYGHPCDNRTAQGVYGVTSSPAVCTVIV